MGSGVKIVGGLLDFFGGLGRDVSTACLGGFTSATFSTFSSFRSTCATLGFSTDRTTVGFTADSASFRGDHIKRKISAAIAAA